MWAFNANIANFVHFKMLLTCCKKAVMSKMTSDKASAP